MSLVLTQRHGRVELITLNHPEKRNTLTAELNEALVAAVDAAEADANVGAVVLTGAGPAFCAGASLAVLGSQPDVSTLRSVYAGCLRVAECRLPTVAAVNGPAVGAGMNLALACDVRVTSTLGRFDSRFLKIGLHSGGGHTWMMRNIAGLQTAAATLLFGQVISGAAAVDKGLAWECTEPNTLVDRAVELAQVAAGGPRELAIALKQTLHGISACTTHAEAVSYEVGPQLWSLEQPFAAQLITSLQQAIAQRPSTLTD